MPGTVSCCKRDVRTGRGVGAGLATAWGLDFGEAGAATDVGAGFLESVMELDKGTGLEGMAAGFAPAGTDALTGNFLADAFAAALPEGLTAFLAADLAAGLGMGFLD